MISAIKEDVVGSRFEFHNHKRKSFDFMTLDYFFTDDTLSTMATVGVLIGNPTLTTRSVMLCS